MDACGARSLHCKLLTPRLSRRTRAMDVWSWDMPITRQHRRWVAEISSHDAVRPLVHCQASLERFVVRRFDRGASFHPDNWGAWI
jgi:hypothetical protein